MNALEAATLGGSALSLVLAGLTYLQTRNRESIVDQRDVLERIVELETKMELVWKDVSFAASFAAASTLHRHDDAHGLDALLEKYIGDALERDEIPLFVERLRAVEQSGATERQRYAAQILLRQVHDRYSEGSGN